MAPHGKIVKFREQCLLHLFEIFIPYIIHLFEIYHYTNIHLFEIFNKNYIENLLVIPYYSDLRLA